MDYARPPRGLGAAGPRRRLPPAADEGRRAANGGGRLRFRLRTLLALALIGLALFATARYWWREMRWRYIVIHHTASDYGNLDYYRRMHVEERGWSNIAYHFVVNNGTANTTIGQIEESELWIERKANLSTRNWFVNYFSIAVVVVGNFQRRPPPPLQMEALVQLSARLSREYGIPPERIVGHREVQNTQCPGERLDMNVLRRAVTQRLAETE